MAGPLDRRFDILRGMLSVLLLGSPELHRDDQPLAVTRRKSRALVYLLAAHPRPLSRDEIISRLWPDHDRPSAQQTLRTTLHGLRKALGDSLVVQDDFLALAPDVEVDARHFESALAHPASDLQSLTSALALYRGDFLSGFALSDAPAFDDWSAGQRERYRRLAIRGLTAVAQRQEANQDHAAALEALDRALAFDPLQEDLQRSALRAHFLAGDRAGAIRRYETLRKLLDDEMGVPPMAETRALYDSIISDTLTEAEADGKRQTAGIKAPPATLARRSPISSLQAPPPPLLPFTGRDAEFRTLHDLALSVPRKLALIEGEPGIGKTRLAEEFACAFRPGTGSPGGGRSTIVLFAGARELEQSLPYQPFIEALRGLLQHPQWPALRAELEIPPLWLAETARLVPEIALSLAGAPPATNPADESRLWEGVHQFLLALSRRRHLMVFIDDLHWADASTLAMLGYLVRQARTEAITFVAATRSVEPRTPLATLVQTLTREGRLARMGLDRLTPDDTTKLARHLSPQYAYPLANWLNSSAEGNPYILAELVRHAHENKLLQPDGTLNMTELSTAPIVPQTVFSLIQSRLARLSDAARRALDAAVAVGRVFEFELVARAAALTENAALDALDELRASGLVRPASPDGLRYSFSHSLTMEVAYREVGEARHRRFHRRVAEAMESLYRNRVDEMAGLLAWHFHEGQDPERAAPYAFRAGEQAAKLAAWKEAIGFFEQAIGGSPESRRGPIYMALGNARFRAGEPAQATEAFRAALSFAEARGDRAAITAATLALAESLLTQARFGDAIALIQQVCTTGGLADSVRAEFIWGTVLSLEGSDLQGALEHLGKAEALLNRQPSSPDSPAGISLSEIKFEQGSVAAQQGDLPRAVELYRQSLAAAEAMTAHDDIWPRLILAHNNLAYHLHLLGHRTEAEEHATIGLNLAGEKGILPMRTFLLSTLGEIALARGDAATAEARFTQGLELAEQLTMPERIAGLTANLGLVARHRGETALAIHHLSTALARADSLGTQHLAAQIRLWLVPLLPPAEARARLAEARAIAENGNRRRLLDEAAGLEEQLHKAMGG